MQVDRKVAYSAENEVVHWDDQQAYWKVEWKDAKGVVAEMEILSVELMVLS